ncbi:acyltransferase [Xanthobacter autotrophicus]|uniref:acyltransferase family protein n=1 Tax=Xanthobacter TaxID=279 RepID=UPI0024AA620D|nr:acyltransferase [Xanthobacter autotrophicus]MDI4666292.1 acyltransferase [Xanthobacter autotrophicus]
MTSNRWGHIDSMRGLAALGVVYFHIAECGIKFGLVNNSIERALFYVFVDVLDLGKVAVVVFFAISGFVIPFSLLKAQNRPLTAFAISRFFRLYPAYWLSIILAVIYLLVATRFSSDAPQGIPRDLGVGAILVNVTMLQQFVGVKNLLGVYWTLQIELIFYMLCAGLFALGLLARPRAALVALLVCLSIAISFALVRFGLGRKMPVALPLGLSVMFWGLVWRYRLTAKDADGPGARRMSNWGTVALVVALPAISVFGYGDDWLRYILTYYVAMVLFVAMTTKFRVSHGIFVWLGLISYSVYLMGPVAQDIVLSLMGTEGLRAVPIHVTFILIAALTVAMSAASYYLVERPAQDIGRRLIARLQSPRSEPERSPATIFPSTSPVPGRTMADPQ